MTPAMDQAAYAKLWELGMQSIKELETEHGILASSRSEAYGCVFGRDSLVTVLFLLSITDRGEGEHDEYFFALARKVLTALGSLQGKEVNIESGEEPGKCIHEWRPLGHEHLTKQGSPPWYLYPDNAMKSYDSVDATPLFLMTLAAYHQATGDRAFVEGLLPQAESALHWLSSYGDANNDDLVEYGFPPERTYGGLKAQNWMDSTESLFYEDKEGVPPYPITPVEVQAYGYAAFRAWERFFKESGSPQAALRASECGARAFALRKRFNEKFVILRGVTPFFPSAFEGTGEALTSVRSSIGHALWAAARMSPEGEIPDCVLEDRFIPSLARRLLTPDLYVPEAGIRTLSSESSHYDARSYHNGSIWPHDTAMCAEGLAAFGYGKEARSIKEGLLKAYLHFETPIELFVYDGGFGEFRRSDGTGACRIQAWSAGALLSVLHSLREFSAG